MSEKEESREKCKFQDIVMFLTLFTVCYRCAEVIMPGADIQRDIQCNSGC